MTIVVVHTLVSLGCERREVAGGPNAATAAPAAPPATVSMAAGSASAVPAPPASAASPVAAIDGSLPSLEDFGLSAKAICPAKTCRRERMVPENIQASLDKQAPAVIWEEDLGAGASVTFPRSSDVDLLGVILSGAVTVATDETKTERAPLAAWRAFLAPGAGVTLSAKTEAVRMVLIVATSGEPVVTLRPPLSFGTWRERPAPFMETDLSAEKDLAWGKGAYHARIAFGARPSQRASLGVLRMSADAPVAPHRHDQEWEHMAILQGDGDFVQGAQGDERATRGSDGTIVSVPPTMRHEWRPSRARPFLGIQVYTPPGPEQRFKKLAAGQ